MLGGAPALLLSIEGSRPAFKVVMGLFLLVVAWRLVHGRRGWAPRCILGGALLLSFGYAVLVPLYEAGMIQRFRPGGHIHGNPEVALSWHVVRLFAMNAGWFLFGLGVALHSRVFAVRPASCPPPTEAPALDVPPDVEPVVGNSHSHELPA